jgi:putative serine/threonine protein kinase
MYKGEWAREGEFRRRPLCLDEVSLQSPEAQLALCYPKPTRGCYSRVQALEGIGVLKLCSTGPTTLPGLNFRVLGKGHASVVVAGVAKGNHVVAVKSRRTDGKRGSLVGEGLTMVEASRVGVAPKPLYYDDDLIVMEAIAGPSLGDMIAVHGVREWIIVEALRAARALDTIGVLHLELSRPWRNILYTGPHEGSKAMIVDYESSGRGCGNVVNLVGGLAKLPELRTLASLEKLRQRAREYKERCTRDLYEDMEEMVVNLIKTLNHQR